MISLKSKGFTIIEIIVTLLILTIIGSLAFRFMGGSMDKIEYAMNKQSIVQANRIFLSSFYRELKMMAPPQEGVDTYLEIALLDQIRWQRYVKGELITIEYRISGNTITRQIVPDGAIKTVLNNVDPASRFLYYKANGSRILSPNTLANRPLVRIVRIELKQVNGEAQFFTRRDIYLENLRD
jgi:prepilin-type N-terminal cleavage/methylation domain-containing protein